jgi:hypothetical protein
MLHKLKSWIATKNLRLGPIEAIKPTAQEDTRDTLARKRVNKVFDDQWETIQARAQKAHDPQCEDSWTCTKDVCWKFVPDKIVKSGGKPRVATKEHWNAGCQDYPPCKDEKHWRYVEESK